MAGHCADLVPDDHTGNEFLSHPFRGTVRLATPAEEAVIGLGLDAPGPHLFGQAMGRCEDEGVSGTEELGSLTWFCRCPRRRLGSSADVGSGDRRGAARRWERGPFLLLCSQAWRGWLRVPSACRGSRPCHATGLGQSHLMVASGSPCRGR